MLNQDISHLASKAKSETLVRSKFSAISDRLFLWSVAALPFTLIAIMMIYPLGYSLYYSFFDFHIYRPNDARFIGLENYTRLLYDSRFWDSMRITAVFTLSITIATVLIGLGLALLLTTEVRGRSVRGRTMIRTALLLPFMLSQAVVGAVFLTFFWDPQFGLVNATLRALGFINPPAWLSDPDKALIVVTITDIWMMFPLVMLVLESALRAIPDSLYEAARIDGANRWQIFVKIVLPLIAPYLVIVIILRLTHAWRMFDLIFIMTGGGPGRRTQVLSLYVYNNFMRFGDFGYANALSWAMILSLVMIAGVVIFFFGRRAVSYANDK